MIAAKTIQRGEKKKEKTRLSFLFISANRPFFGNQEGGRWRKRFEIAASSKKGGGEERGKKGKGKIQKQRKLGLNGIRSIN